MNWWQITLVVVGCYVVAVGLLLALFDGSNIPTPTPPVPESFDEFFARLDREFAERKQ
jgi:hypothetical protein